MASKNYNKKIEEFREERSRRENVLSGKTTSPALAQLQRRYLTEYLPAQASSWAKSLNDFQKKISADAQARSKGYQSQESLKAYQDSVNEQIANLKASSKYAQEYARLSGDRNYIKSITDSLGYLDNVTKGLQDEQAYWANWADEDAYKASPYYFNNEYADAAKNYDVDVIATRNSIMAELLGKNKKPSGMWDYGNETGFMSIDQFAKATGLNKEYITNELTDDEVRMYALIKDTVGIDEASKYIHSMAEDLSYRQGVKKAQKSGSYLGLINPPQIIKDIAGVFESGGAGIENALAGLVQTTMNTFGNTEAVIPTPSSVYAHQIRQENADGLDKVIGDLAFTTGNMLPSIGVSAASKSPLLGAGITAMSSGGNAYAEARRQGYSHEQATAYGMINGSLEGGLQYALGGIGKLGGKLSGKVISKVGDKLLPAFSNIKSGAARAVLSASGKFLGKASSEAFEEGLQSVLDPLVRSMVLQEDLNIDWNEVGYSAMLGAMSAGLWEGGSIVSNSVQANTIGKKAFENGSWQGALDYALALDPNSKPYQLAKALQDGSIKADGNNVGNLYSALVEYMQESKTLVRKGKMTTDQYVSAQNAISQIYEARSKAEAENNASAGISPNIMSARLYQEIKGLGLDEKTAIKYSNAIANLKEGTEVRDKLTNELISGNSPVKNIVARELGIDATNKTAAELRNAVKSYVDTVKSQPKTETAEQTAPKTEKELQYEQAKAATAQLSKVLGEKGQAVYNEFSEGMRTGDSLMYFNNAVFDFYNQGVEASLKKNPPKKYTDIARYEGIAPIIKQRAFEAGKLDNATKAEAVKKTTEKVKSDIKEIKARQKELKHVEFDIKDLAPSAGKWTVDEDVDVDNLKGKQNAAFNYLKAVSEVSGINVHIMSGVNKSGELTAENGFYDSNTNTVYVSINAGAQSLTDITNTAVLKTASHEITHYIAATDTDAYQELRDYVVETFKKEHGEDGLARRVSQLQDIYLDQINKELTYEKAIEEMVANACETMIRDSKVFSQLVRQNMTVAERLKDGLDRFITKMDKNREAALEGIEETSLEARLIASNADTLKKAQELWDNALKAAIKKNQEASVNTESDGKMFEVRGYDFSKSFAEQIDDYKAGKFPKRDTLIVSGTPKAFQEIGLHPLPMTYTQGHLKDALANKDGDHLGETLLKKLPEALKSPIAIIDSTSKPGRLVAIVEIQNHPRNVLAAVEVDGEGVIHDFEIHANAVATAHSRDNAISKLLKDAVKTEVAKQGGIYYWQKNKAIQKLSAFGVQFPGSQQIPDGYVRSITDPLSKVKRNFDSVTETKQFERWFGDWQNNPRRASKVVNADGTPKIMYHGTAQLFTVFDRKKARPGFYGRGFYFTDSESHAKQYGNAMPVYLNIRNPLVPGQSKVNVNQIRSFLEAVAANEDYSIENYGENSSIESILRSITSRDAFDVIQDINATAIGDFGEAMRLFNEVNGTKYDGVITPTETIVYEPTQIKSASQDTDMDNIGTFDRNNPDIRYELRDNQGRELTKAQAEKFKDSLVRDKDGRLITVYHGSSAVFNVFSAVFVGQHGSAEGQGFYFTDYKDMAEGYQKKGGQLLEGYLNITNPLSDSEVTLSATEVKRLLKALDPTGDDVILNYDSKGGKGYPSQAWYNRALADAVNMIMSTSESDSEILAEIANAGAGSGNVMDTVRKVLGYDGYIVEGKYDNATVYVAFGSDQFKSFDNKTPTSSPDIRYSLRYDETEFNARRELSTALLTVAQTDAERKSLENYQKKVKVLNEREKIIADRKNKLARLDQVKDAKRYAELQNEIRQQENLLNRADTELTKLEATKPLKDILTRKEARLKEQFARSSTTRAKHRNSIKQKIRSLDQKLRTNSGEKHIISEFQPVVAKLLTACTNNTSVFKRAQLDRLKAIYEKFDPGEDNRRLKEHPELSEYMAKYAPIVAESIELITPILENRRLADLDAETLAALDNVISGVHKMIVDADKVFAGNRVAQMRDISESSMVDAENSGFSRNTMTNTGLQAFFNYKNTLPVYVMERLGNTVMEYLWKPLENASYEMIREQVADTEFLQGKMKQHGYNSWKDKTLNIKLESGETIAMTQEQAMSIYALARREETHKGIGGKRINHLGIGGIIIPDIVKENIVDENGKVEKYLGLIPKKRPALNKTVGTPLTDADIAKIKKMLTTEQKAYVDDMVKYMSTVIAARGNAVSQKLYGIDIFTEEYYFPIVSDKNFLQTNFTGQAEKLIKNAGMTKSLTENANNPIVVDDFSTVVAQHLQQMERYDTLAVPLDNFNRWLNYLSYDLDAEGNRIAKNGKGVKSTLEAVYGTNMTSYINQMLKDANANSIKGSNESFIDRLIGRFRKNAVLASLSVAIQQPSAMHRAHAYIDRKHFGYGFKTGWTHYHENLEEMLKYSGAAFVKEHGSFDPAVSNNAIDDMLFVTPEGWQKVLQMFNLKDATWRDQVLGTLPKAMDRITWVRIWNAVKNETKANNRSMDVNSEEFLKKAGERFDYVINRTQVYDSVLSKSELMRSKSTTMKALTSFGAEPTVAYNMLLKANTEMALAISKGEGKKTAGKFLARTIFAFLEASFVNALLKSLVTAARKDKPDDEDDKSYLEWYAHQLVNNFISDASPLGLLPVAREVQTLLEGYDLTNSQLDLLATMFDAVLTAADEDKPLEKKLEKIASAIGYAFGIPAENIIRDVGALINVYTDIASGWSTDWEGIKDAAQEGGADATILPIVPDATANTADKLYKAMMNGDKKAQAEYYANLEKEYNEGRAKGKYKNYSSAKSYISSQLRERLKASDDIKALYEASEASNFAEYNAIKKKLIEKGFTDSDIVLTLNNYRKAIKEQAQNPEAVAPEETEETAVYDKEHLVNAIENNKEAEVLNEWFSGLKRGTEEYKDMSARIKRYITQTLKPQYQDAFLASDSNTAAAIYRRLKSYGKYGIVYDDNTIKKWRESAAEDRA